MIGAVHALLRRMGPALMLAVLLSGAPWSAVRAEDAACTGSLAIRLYAAGAHLGPFAAGEGCVAGIPDALGLIYWTYSPIRGQVGNGGLTVTLAEGARLIGVFWPSPILYDHNGGAFGYETQPQAPDRGRGAASGVRYGIRDGERFVWLDDARFVQRTRYAGARSLRLLQEVSIPELDAAVTIESFVDPRHDVLVQHLRITDTSGRARNLALVHYENLTPTDLALPLTTSTISDTVIDAPLEQVTVTANGIEHGALGVPVAFIWDAQPQPAQRMAGLDTSALSDGVAVTVNGLPLATGTLPANAPDAYTAATGNRWLPVTQVIGPANAAQQWPLALPAGGSAEVTVYAAAGSTAAAARDALRAVRGTALAELRATVDAHWWTFTERAARRPALAAEAPADAERLERLFWRGLLVLGMNLDRGTGLLSAGAFRQPPYGASWPRDTAVTAYILGELGYRQEAQRALLGTAALQRPDGGFGGASYNNGAPWPFNEGLPLTYFGGQVDGAGWFVWSAQQHYARTQDRAFLQAIWPSVRKAADFLAAWRDPGNGGHLASNEEDRFLPGQTIAGDVAVIMGLRAAGALATVLGETPAPGWAQRADDIEASLAPNYWRPDPGYFAWLTTPLLGGEYPLTADPSYDPIMWDHSNLIWPGRLFAPPHADAHKTAQHMDYFWSLMWEGEPGGRLLTEPYNTGLGWFATSLSGLEDQGLLADGRARARIILRWLAQHAAPETALIGEVTTLDRLYPQSYGAPHSWAHAFAIQGMLAAWPQTADAPRPGDGSPASGGALMPLTLGVLALLAGIARRRRLCRSV
ncbi:Glucoamylase (glucan-1,4-alpha-glucosidase), GH15 family [Fontimonas thermophila]|uniref:Glucoamylase (Glucan-1,4-alpha-glucosidase), GH15 family n=1 Tax=Fontimonas thermophila TaxID=1076937 RepID=A0A1I2HEB5_9GAMM|nr:hypothetical protein [Fontimonas thermophila]SFF27267.1 Glucoamylase (glucan-1,4-alpha-glucosidase), GH15 family [Fontimonas thermophila]